MHRRAVHRRKPRRDLHGADGVGGFHRPHRTTSGPWNGPAGHGRDRSAVHRHGAIAVMWRSSMPPSSSACSNENEQPMAKVTRSSRQPFHYIVVGSSTSAPSARPDSAADRCGYRDPRRVPACADRRAADTPTSGHGFGLSWQNRKKSSAKRCGRIANWPARNPAPARCRAGMLRCGGCQSRGDPGRDRPGARAGSSIAASPPSAMAPPRLAFRRGLLLILSATRRQKRRRDDLTRSGPGELKIREYG